MLSVCEQWRARTLHRVAPPDIHGAAPHSAEPNLRRSGGAYVYGRSASQTTLEDGRKKVVRGRQLDRTKWTLIPDHHESYISLDNFESNQRQISNNTNMLGEQVQGSARSGDALLAGLLRCGHCGHRLTVWYRRPGGCYQCRDPKSTSLTMCISSIGAHRMDESVCEEVLRRLQPLGIEAALQAIETQEHAGGDVRRHVELALEQARYYASLARRKYDAVDPDNRLVAGELERRWNERLLAVETLERRLADLTSVTTERFSEDERRQLLALGSDLEKLWNHPAASVETRKRILRTVIKEIIVRVDGDHIDLKLHWHGGDHTELALKKPTAGQHRNAASADTLDLVRALARLLPDAGIAQLLNRLRVRTGTGKTWNAVRVCGFRHCHDIAVYRDGERAERGEVNLQEAAQLLNAGYMVVLRLIQRKVLPAKQPCLGAPWSILRSDLDLPAVRKVLRGSGVRRSINRESESRYP